jgi:hypothetical protein
MLTGSDPRKKSLVEVMNIYELQKHLLEKMNKLKLKTKFFKKASMF